MPCASWLEETPSSRMALAVRFLHVLSAITWIGGMLFVALVLVPVTRRLPDPALRRRSSARSACASAPWGGSRSPS
jgi:putative copper export protein